MQFCPFKLVRVMLTTLQDFMTTGSLKRQDGKRKTHILYPIHLTLCSDAIQWARLIIARTFLMASVIHLHAYSRFIYTPIVDSSTRL